MTIERPVAEPAALPAAPGITMPEISEPEAGPLQAAGDSGPGERLRRLRRRRRLLREELLAVLVLLLVLAATVAVLATQWLSSGTSTNAFSYLFSGGST